jgi:GNAT superfamily N-acetyltransferase
VTSVRRLDRPTDAERAQLAEVLVDCVRGGASVNFMLPFGTERALEWWRKVEGEVAAGERALFVAEDGEGICGTVQLLLATPENQPHRAEVSKMLVHRRARRRGVGAALLREAETFASHHGRSVLVLDTASPDAERLYSRAGWVRVGVIPDYALLPAGGYCATTFFYRALGAGSGAP